MRSANVMIIKALSGFEFRCDVVFIFLVADDHKSLTRYVLDTNPSFRALQRSPLPTTSRTCVPMPQTKMCETASTKSSIEPGISSRR